MAGWDRATNTPHHPIPDTLDGARDAFPPGWRWKKLDGSFVAYNEDGMYVDVDDTTDEKLDRFRLACGAWRAVKGIV